MATEEQGAESLGRDSSFSRLVGALFNPRQTFQSVAQKPDWVPPILLILLVNVLLVASFTYRVGWRGTVEKQLAKTPAYAQMTPLQQQQAVDRFARLAPIGGYIGSTVGTVLVLLCIALVLLGAFNIIFGTTIKFRQSFSIASYAFIPTVLKGLLAILIVWVRAPEGINLQNMVMSNVGAFLPSAVPLWLQTLGSLLDVFVFWTLALLAIGYVSADRSRKLRFGSSLAVVVAIWFVYLFIMVGVSAISV